MGDVFLATMEGVDGYSREVAVKLIRPHLLEEESSREGFLREAHLGGKLRHPNIVLTLLLDRVGEVYCLAMEFVHGPTLEQLLAHHRERKVQLPLPVALELAVQLCEGLDYAHGALDGEGRPLGIVHRDLKPANLLLSEFGELKITDFGVARAAIMGKHTSTGIIKGTVAYMSPEQARGERDLDTRSDLFSLGLILYELLTLERVFPEAYGLQGLMRVEKADVEAQLARLAGQPPELRALLTTLLARDRVYRPASARTVRRVLETLPQMSARGRQLLKELTSEINHHHTMARVPPTTSGRGGDHTSDSQQVRPRLSPEQLVESDLTLARPGTAQEMAAVRGIEVRVPTETPVLSAPPAVILRPPEPEGPMTDRGIEGPPPPAPPLFGAGLPRETEDMDEHTASMDVPPDTWMNHRPPTHGAAPPLFLPQMSEDVELPRPSEGTALGELNSEQLRLVAEAAAAHREDASPEEPPADEGMGEAVDLVFSRLVEVAPRPPHELEVDDVDVDNTFDPQDDDEDSDREETGEQATDHESDDVATDGAMVEGGQVSSAGIPPRRSTAEEVAHPPAQSPAQPTTSPGEVRRPWPRRIMWSTLSFAVVFAVIWLISLLANPNHKPQVSTPGASPSAPTLPITARSESISPASVISQPPALPTAPPAQEPTLPPPGPEEAAAGEQRPNPAPRVPSTQDSGPRQPGPVEDPLPPTPATPTRSPTNMVNSKLEKGRLSLNSDPFSNVYLGSRYLGYTPLIRVPVDPGRQTLTLKAEGLPDMTVEVVVEPGRDSPNILADFATRGIRSE